jgi:UDP-N-acetylglucosamine 4,6-dehydratase/5-epimerase
MKRILIVGGSGSWGQELTRQLLQREPETEITVYSRGEHRQVSMHVMFNDPRLKFVIGDIRDADSLKRAARGMDTIFHLAALKHVPVCERNPEEAIKTNIAGTLNAVNVALEQEVGRFVLVSTDKAVDPINVYGVSKSMAEKVVINANLQSEGTIFVCIRGGNVLGTQGSVVPLFKEQILRANEITITDPAMTRYLMRLEEAISLIFKASSEAIGGEIFVMKMPSARITDLADVMIKNLGNRETRVRSIGIRPGEKLHEALVSRNEGARAVEHGQYYVILPTMDIRNVYAKWDGTPFLDREYSSSANQFLSQGDLEVLLEKDGWFNDVRQKWLDDFSEEDLLSFFKKEGWNR